MVLAVLLLITLVVGVVGAASRSARKRTRPALLMSPAATLSPTEQVPVHGVVTADHTATTPANGAAANLRAALDRWRTAGLITDAQAASIEQHELTLLQAARPVPAHDTRRGIPLVAEALGYLGGTLGIVGLTLLVSRYWPDMATAGRLGLSGGAAVLLAGAGYSVHEGADPAFTRLRWFLWLVSSAAGALFAGVLATQTFGADAPATIALACATLIAAQNAVFWAGARRPLQQLLTLTASMVAAGAFVAQFAGSATVGTALWAVGAGLLAVGLLHRTTFPPLTVGVGAATMIVGTAMAAESLQGPGFVMMVLTALGLLTLASVPIDIGDPADRVVLTVIGAVGSAQALPMTIGYFAEHAAVATGLVVWSVGGGLVFVASRKLVRSPIATEIIGGVALVAGAAITGVQSVAFATLFGTATAAALIALGTQPGRVLLSLFGSLGLLVNVPWAIRHFFPGEGRVPLLILASGAVIVLVAVWLARMSGRLRRELRH